MDSVQQVIDMLQKESGIDEIAQVTYFEGYREGVGKVKIEVHDRGEDSGNLRFHVHAYTVDLEGRQKTANSNAEADLDLAIGTTHWQNLAR